MDELQAADDGGGSKTIKILLIVLGSFLALTFACCGGIWLLGDSVMTAFVSGRMVEGSGVLAEQTRPIRNFTGVRAQGSIDVEITIGDEWSVALSADDNILPMITTEVDDGVLVLDVDGSYSTRSGLRVKIVMPSIDYVEASDTSEIRISGIEGESLRAEVEDSGELSATGTVDTLVLRVDDAGDAMLGGLVARIVSVDVKSSGEAEVHATEHLKAAADDAGDIRYRGEPAKVETKVDAAGSISPLR